MPQQQEPVVQQEDAAVQQELGGHEEPDQGTAGGQHPDAPQGEKALGAVDQRNNPRQYFAGWQGGRAGSSAPTVITREMDDLGLPEIGGRPKRRRRKLDKFV